jgi:hypothetical protein
VLIQLLNLVQSWRLSHTFFFGPALQENFFFTCGPTLLTQLPYSKKIPTYSAPLPMLWIFFFQNSLSFCCHCHCCCCKLKEWCHHSLLLLMLREELGVATTSRCEQHKVQHLQEDTKTRYVFYIFSLHLRFLYIFSLGLGL